MLYDVNISNIILDLSELIHDNNTATQLVN